MYNTRLEIYFDIVIILLPVFSHVYRVKKNSVLLDRKLI